MKTVKRTYKLPFKYKKNLFWGLFFLIFWLPLGVILCIKNGCLIKENVSLYFQYRGSWGWVYFWSIVFFPIAIILLFFQGLDVMEETIFEDHSVV